MGSTALLIEKSDVHPLFSAALLLVLAGFILWGFWALWNRR